MPCDEEPLPCPDRRLRTLFFTPWYPTRNNPAPAVFVLEHARAAALNHDVTVAVSTVDASAAAGSTRLERESYGGLPTIRLAQGRGFIPKLRYLSRLRNEVRFLNDLCSELRPDLIHAVNYAGGVPAAIVGRRRRIPYVVSEHWSGFYSGTVTGVELLKARYGLGKAARLLPVSGFLAGRIVQHGIAAPTTIIPNAIDADLFRYAPAPPPEGTDRPLRAIAVGNLVPIKGMDLLAAAMERLKGSSPGLTATIVGEGSERGALEAGIRERKLDSVVTLTGALEKPALYRLMQQSDFMISASRGETFGVAVLEGMAAGLPVVAARVGALPEIIDENRGIFVQPESPGALADGIRRMMNELGRFNRKKMSEEVREQFSLERIGGLIDEVYREVVHI